MPPLFDLTCDLFIVLSAFSLFLAQALCLSFATGINRSGNTCTLALENLTTAVRITPP